MNKEDATLAFVDMLCPLAASHRVRAWPEQDGTEGESPWEGRGSCCLEGGSALRASGDGPVFKFWPWPHQELRY